MDTSDLWDRLRPLRARVRSALAGTGCAPSEVAALAVLVAGAVLLLGVLWLRTPGPEEADAQGEGSARGDAAAEAGGRADGEPSDGLGLDAAAVVVHVAGAVTTPGVYELAGGARVADALEAAGGATAEAVLDDLNLARQVDDGERILVPDQRAAAAAEDTGRRADGRVDVNRASASQLEELPGVGPVLAERIVEHREAHGPFTDTRDLLEVSGIGERMFETLIDDIGV